MLTSEVVEALQKPIGEASPCGDDLEYDPAFTALEAAAQGKPEQQFGDTVIPAVEPEWRVVSEQAQAVLRRAKDVRAAMLLLRAATRLQGVTGFVLGMQLLIGLLDRFWEQVHPQLDADDDNDPTMRLNAMAPLVDENMVLRDLYDANVGMARGVGPIRVRDIAIAHNALAAGGSDSGYSAAQVQGGLEDIHAQRPEALASLSDVGAEVQRLQSLLSDRTGRTDAIELVRLRALGKVLRQAAQAVAGGASDTAADAAAPSDAQPDGGHAATARAPAARGEIQSRQDALLMLDRVIHYLQQSEPGNPAPLLIERAKKLIGVSFLEIMQNLAPNALDTIETVTGARPSGD
ncbi:MAG: type VI secretion system protein TssA [Pseudomonadota bacterium]